MCVLVFGDGKKNLLLDVFGDQSRILKELLVSPPAVHTGRPGLHWRRCSGLYEVSLGVNAHRRLVCPRRNGGFLQSGGVTNLFRTLCLCK